VIKCKILLRCCAALLLGIILFIVTNKWNEFIFDEDQNSIESSIQEDDILDLYPLVFEFLSTDFFTEISFNSKLDYHSKSRFYNLKIASFFKRPLFILYNQFRLGDSIY
jgi:hypothetical protein